MFHRLAVLAAGALAVVVFTSAAADARPPALKLKQNFVTGLDNPWDMGFLADRTMFFTERSGRISVRIPGGEIRLLAEPPDLLDEGKGAGMLGLAVDPDFGSNRFIYTCQSSDLADDPATPEFVEADNRVVRWTVNEAFTGMDDRLDIVTGIPYYLPDPERRGKHSGCRPRFQPGTNPPALIVGTGDANTGTVPQDKQSLGGKILRVTRDGNPYPGNPGVDDPGTGYDPRILNRGHRNVQGIGFRPGTNRGYSSEHGPGERDEVNKIKGRRNYGWDPVPGYNEDSPMTDRKKFPNAMRPAWHSGNKTIAPSGLTFLEGDQWHSWNGRIALAALDPNPNIGQHLRILKVRRNGSINRARDIEVFADLNTRLRSAVQGPDGRLYIATDVPGPGGAIWKVTPS